MYSWLKIKWKILAGGGWIILQLSPAWHCAHQRAQNLSRPCWYYGTNGSAMYNSQYSIQQVLREIKREALGQGSHVSVGSTHSDIVIHSFITQLQLDLSIQTKPVKTFKFSFFCVESVLFPSCSVGAESCWHHCHSNRHKDHLVITELWGQRWWGEALLRKGSSLLKLVFTRQCVHSTLPVVVIYFPRVIAPSPIKKTHRRLIIWYKAPVQR